MKTVKTGKQLSPAEAFRKFTDELGREGGAWFGDETLDTLDDQETVIRLTLPFEFLAEKLGMKISMAVETSGKWEPHCIVCHTKIELEDLQPEADSLMWKNNAEFDRWFEEKTAQWTKTMAIAELLFG